MLRFNRHTSESTEEAPRLSNLRRQKGQGNSRGALIFTREQTQYIRHHLTRLLRVICIRMNITTDEYDRRQTWFWKTRGDTNGNGRSSSKGNLSKSIEPDTITWRAFLKFVEMILRLDILEVKIRVRDEYGIEHEYSSTDPLDDIDPSPQSDIKSSSSNDDVDD